MVSSDHARQFEGKKVPDLLYRVDQALKRVPHEPVAIPSGHPRAKPKAWLGPPRCPDQPEGQKSPDLLHRADQALKIVPHEPVAIPSGHTRAKPKAWLGPLECPEQPEGQKCPEPSPTRVSFLVLRTFG